MNKSKSKSENPQVLPAHSQTNALSCFQKICAADICIVWSLYQDKKLLHLYIERDVRVILILDREWGGGRKKENTELCNIHISI